MTVSCSDNRAAPEHQLVNLERCEAQARAVLAGEGVVAGATLDIALIDQDHITELNEAHLGGTGPTDVLSFPMLEPHELAELTNGAAGPPTMLGDIVICPDIVSQRRGDDTFDDAMDLMVVHGVLHILGHDHDIEERAVVMREREYHYLKRQTPTAARPSSPIEKQS